MRPRVAGKFVWVGDEKWYVRGVTYGTFRPGPDGDFPAPAVVERDFTLMSAHGVNTVRVYTVPPRWLLDLAWERGLRVLVGLPWEQHVTFLDEPGLARDIERRVRTGVRACAGHPALLAYAVGNEIPPGIVRWHGRRPIEAFIERLCAAVKNEDPGGLVTYVNFPPTEYLCLPSVDFLCFNVYLEDRERLRDYLARLQNLAGDRPLVMTELGLDSRRNGCDAQAEVLEWQVRGAFAAGCAGVFVFSWTDEWHRGGFDIDDWDFGLVDRERRPKPALAAVADAFSDAPFVPDDGWPRLSVVVCSYNGARTIRDCLEGLAEQAYPYYEVLVVDDGSTDATATIAAEYVGRIPGLRVLSGPNGGLSAARNVGMRAASGEILCYTDDDARPDPHWLLYLAHAFRTSPHVAIGGPNIPAPGDGPIAECVANAPGGPIHVLLSDTEAEHIPGCNFSVRKAALEAIGGFDPRYRVAGDDVDACWRLQARGWTIGFAPAAFVWHHRRNSLRTYLKQQHGYGKAEALLEYKWPDKYNELGHVSWSGRLYGYRLEDALTRRRGVVYHGTWGSAMFQSLYNPAPGVLASIATMPEWYFVTVLFAVLSVLGLEWRPLLGFVPLLLLAVWIPVAQALLATGESTFPSRPTGRARLRLLALTAALHLAQPIARLIGRVRHGLTPWRPRRVRGAVWPTARVHTLWSERWSTPESRLVALERVLRRARMWSTRGGGTDRWDLEVRGGLLGAARLGIVVEEHGAGRQLTRVRVWPRRATTAVMSIVGLAGLAAAAAFSEAWVSALALGGLAAGLLGRATFECGRAVAAVQQGLLRAAPRWGAAAVVQQTRRAPADREVPLPVGDDTEPALPEDSPPVGDGRGDGRPRPPATLVPDVLGPPCD